MGCDIHVYAEYRVDGGAWQTHPDTTVEKDEDEDYYDIYLQTNIYRNYSLFAALAGVRGEGPEAKGIPNNLSPIVKKVIEQWDCDGHSHSYMSLDEFHEILKEQGYSIKEMPLYKSCKKLTKELGKIEQILLDSTKPSVVEHRVVFFFDN